MPERTNELRRGACPALFTPMQTGDGLLARIVPGDRIAPAALAAFCRAAARHGNGTIEVTARGSLQVRGLSDASAPLFAAEVEELGVAVDGVPIITDPLADDPATLLDAAAIAQTLRAAIVQADIALPPKVSVIVDGGGRLNLDALTADLRLRAFAVDDEMLIHVALAGNAATATALGSVPVESAADVALGVLRVIATHRDARAADVLRSEGVAAFSDVLTIQREDTDPQPRPAAAIIGLHPVRDGLFALGVALSFGHAHASVLEDLAGSAAARGVRALRPAPGRALLLIGLSKPDALALARDATRLGFIIDADDPRRRIVACPGKPACASGLIAARALAAEIARGPQPPGTGIAVHVSGCAKGCAHPGPAPLTIVGTERGCGIIHRGSARATPHAYVDPRALAAEVAHA